jgi:hypothetical protein
MNDRSEVKLVLVALTDCPCSDELATRASLLLASHNVRALAVFCLRNIGSAISVTSMILSSGSGCEPAAGLIEAGWKEEQFRLQTPRISSNKRAELHARQASAASINKIVDEQ